MQQVQPIFSSSHRKGPQNDGAWRSPPAGAGGYPAHGGGGGGYGPGMDPGMGDADDMIDFRALFSVVWRGKWIIAVCVIFGAIMGSLLTTQQTPLYRASAKVMFESSRANIEAGEDVVNSSVARGPLQNQIEVLRSVALIQRVVDDLALTENPAFNPFLRPPPPPTWRDKLVLPPEIQDLLIAMGLREPPRPAATDPDPAVIEAQANRIAVNTVLSGLRLTPIEGSRVIDISYISTSPTMSARIVNSVAEQYIVDQLEGKLETFRSATTWLTDRVADLQERVETAESAILEAQARVTDQVGASLQAVQQQLTTLTQRRAALRTEASEMEARYVRLTGALESGAEIGMLPEFRDTPSIAALLEREDALMLEDETLSATLRESHPSRERIADALERVRRDIRQEAQEILEALRLERDLAREREAQLSTEIAALEAQNLELSTESVEIRNLEREAQASRILYENLLSRLQETNAQEDLQSADARILTPAQVPFGPINTTKNRTMGLAIAGGFFFGIGLVFLLDRLNNTFRSPGQLEKMLGYPVLATVPQVGPRMARSDVVGTLRAKPNSSLAESIRNLRTSILFSNVDDPPRVVMFSSSVPREGKSTTAMLMALTSRQMGKTAIIVDCDLRMPALGKVLKVDDDRPGLLSVIDESATVSEAVFVEPDTGLHVLMTRASERTAKINAADVLASEKFHHLIEALSKSYDLVVLDTPPTLVVTDARIVSGLADAAVFCVRYDKTPRAAVKEGLRELASVNARLTGVVMTMVNEQRASKYAYDGYSYYKGRYRDYYEA